MKNYTKRFFLCILSVILIFGMISCDEASKTPSGDVTTDSNTSSPIEQNTKPVSGENTTEGNEGSETKAPEITSGAPTVTDTTTSPETTKSPDTTSAPETTLIPETTVDPNIGMEEEDANGLVYVYLGNGECAVKNNGYRSKLQSITIPEKSPSGYTVTVVNSMSCFSLTEEIILPQTLKAIDSYAFSMLDAVKKLVIPDSVETIGDGAFSNCSALESITFGSGIREFGINPVSGSFALKEMTFRSGNPKFVCVNKCIIDVTTKTLKFGIDGAVIPNDGSVEHIEREAFRAVRFLGKTVIIPDSVKTIGQQAFMSCSFSAVKIGSGVETIGDGAFERCAFFTEIIIPPNVKKIENCAFLKCESLETVVLNEGLEIIESSTFADCTKLENINIPSTVTSFGSNVFGKCKNLVTIAIPGSIKVVQGSTFYQCSNLKYIFFMEGVEMIASNALSGCNRLEYVVIPKSMKSLGDKNFVSSKLTKIYYGGLPADKENLGMGYNNTALGSAEWYYYGADKAAGLDYKYWILLDGPTAAEVP